MPVFQCSAKPSSANERGIEQIDELPGEDVALSSRTSLRRLLLHACFFHEDLPPGKIEDRRHSQESTRPKTSPSFPVNRSERRKACCPMTLRRPESDRMIPIPDQVSKLQPNCERRGLGSPTFRSVGCILRIESRSLCEQAIKRPWRSRVCPFA